MNGDVGPPLLPDVKTEKQQNGSKLITDPTDPDPIIHEIPVFLAKNLASKLFMFQVKTIVDAK